MNHLLLRTRCWRINRKHHFWIKDVFVSVSNRTVISIYFWRCTTTNTRCFIFASACTILSLILCSVKSAFALILLSLNFFNWQFCKTRKLSKNVSAYQMAMWCMLLPYYPTNPSHVIGHFISCLPQIRICSVSLARRVLDLALLVLRALHKILCKQFSLCS